MKDVMISKEWFEDVKKANIAYENVEFDGDCVNVVILDEVAFDVMSHKEGYALIQNFKEIESDIIKAISLLKNINEFVSTDENYKAMNLLSTIAMDSKEIDSMIDTLKDIQENIEF